MRLTMDEAATLPPDKPTPQHHFRGRTDRWCEVCDRPDRNPVHIPTVYVQVIAPDLVADLRDAVTG